MKTTAAAALALSAATISALISAPAHAALPSDCVQSDYPVRVIPACTEILRQDPNSAIALFKRGKAHLDYLTKRELPLAIADLTKAIEIDAKYADSYHLRGIAWQFNGELPRAIADQSKAIEINPAFAGAYYYRGLVHQEQGDDDHVLADYNRAIEIDPAYTPAYLNRALIRGLVDPDRAIADLKRALKLGHDFFNLNPANRSKFTALVTRAIERDARDAVAYYMRGAMSAGFADAGNGRISQSDYDNAMQRAISDYNKAIELDPKYIDAYVARGRAYTSQSFDDARALADFNEAIKLDPNNARVFRARGDFYWMNLELNDPAAPAPYTAAALGDYNKAIELDPAYGEAYTQRSLFHAIFGRYALAKADLAKALDIDWRLCGVTVLYPKLLDEIEAERQTRQ
jgi:tetratricopeptide (TPR) repeat protein